MESFPEIDFTEDGASGNLVSEVSEMRKRELIQFSLEIKQSEVTDWAEESVGFWREMKWATVSISFRRIYFFNNTQSH